MDLENLSREEQACEEMLMSILQREGNIEGFLDSIFKFLCRRYEHLNKTIKNFISDEHFIRFKELTSF
jgi:hypothetical protein